MLIDLANVLGHRIANSIDLIEEDQAVIAVTAALDAARELLGASKAMAYQVTVSDVQGRPDVLRRFACSPSEVAESRRPNYEVIEKGVWTYVYDTNTPIWVINANEDYSKVPKSRVFTEKDDQTAYCPRLKNHIPRQRAGEGSTGESMPELDPFYNFVDRGSKTVITIPFRKTIEERDACWGILDIEFNHPVAYSADQFNALQTLTDHISNIAWKARAWGHTTSDTKCVIKEFVAWCGQISSATLPYKTGLWIHHHFSDQTLHDDLLDCFDANFVQMDEYTLETHTTKLPMTLNLNIRQTIEKEHFGVVDLTRWEQVPDLLVVLGLFAMKSRPCLVLSSLDSAEEIPPIIALIAQQTIGAQPGERLLHVYEYDIPDKDVVFFRNGFEVDKRSVVTDFLESVRTQSRTFRAAHDYGPES